MITPAQKKVLKKINNAPYDTISETMISCYGELRVVNNLVKKGFLQKFSQDNGIIVFKRM